MKQTTKTVGMGWIAVIIIAAILIVDQIIKIEVKTNMSLGEALRITDWFYIEFIENNGMAYGMTFINKLVLSLVRMFAICGIGWYIWRVVKSGLFSKGYIVNTIIVGIAKLFHHLCEIASGEFQLFVNYLLKLLKFIIRVTCLFCHDCCSLIVVR